MKLKTNSKYIILTVLIIILLTTSSLYSEKKKFGFDDAIKFKSLTSLKLSDDGAWIAFVSNPDRGDGEVIVKSTISSRSFSIERGSTPFQFDKKASFIVVSTLPKTLETLNAKTEKDKPKKGMTLLDLSDGSSNTFENVSIFNLSNDGKWLAYKKLNDKDSKSDDKKKKAIGEDLTLRHISSKTEINIAFVVDFTIDSSSNYLIYTISDEKGFRDGIYFRDLNATFAPEKAIEAEKNVTYSNVSFSNINSSLAYTRAKLDSNNKPLDCDIKIWYFKNSKIELLLKDSTQKGWFVPNKNSLIWSKDGKDLTFGFKPYSEKVGIKDEKPKFSKDNLFNFDEIRKETQLFMWHPNDDQILTKQKKDWDVEKDRTYKAFINIDSKSLTQLADTNIQSVVLNENRKFAIGYDDEIYSKEYLYSGDYSDLYSINLTNNKRNIVAKHLSEGASLSPKGNYIVYYQDKNWFIYNNNTNETKNLTQSLNVPFYNLEHDTPETPSSCGFGAWLENDSICYINSELDIWEYNTTTNIFNNITKSFNTNNTSYRIKLIDSEKSSISLKDTILLTYFNKDNKESGLISYNLANKTICNKIGGKYFYRSVIKAKDNNRIIFNRENYQEFPDVWSSNMNLNSNQITNLHSDIKDYNWGNTELVSYKTQRGDSLQGYLIKPDNYDPKKKYPILIYFYERMSDDANKFNMPAINHRPCYQVYLSDGYLMFFPDIKYYTGSPGQNATDVLLSSSKKLVELGIADSNKIAIWGHSWSAYQGSLVATQTNYFKAIVAGAPVGNMTSAYSGIRLESGRARQFQYEKQQSRIGGNIVDSLSAYIRNSPIFFADKMNTPLLIAHGDIDEAVPFSQGVELHLAMRRFNKNCILLQYENEPHHLKKYPNKVDYAIRMKEFYDTYVKGTPAPSWITNGIKYKGDYNIK
jgi:dipeptidyl aminopeptidase/acylaminoacyl peptidase